MRRHWPLLLVIAGLSLLLGSLVFKSFRSPPHIVGITSDQTQARSQRYDRIAFFLFWGGAVTNFAGVTACLVRAAFRGDRQPPTQKG